MYTPEIRSGYFEKKSDNRAKYYLKVFFHLLKCVPKISKILKILQESTSGPVVLVSGIFEEPILNFDIKSFLWGGAFISAGCSYPRGLKTIEIANN